MKYTVTTLTRRTESFEMLSDLFDALDEPDNLLCRGSGAEVDCLGVWLFNTNEYLAYRKKIGPKARPLLKHLLAMREGSTKTARRHTTKNNHHKANYGSRQAT